MSRVRLSRRARGLAAVGEDEALPARPPDRRALQVEVAGAEGEAVAFEVGDHVALGGTSGPARVPAACAAAEVKPRPIATIPSMAINVWRVWVRSAALLSYEARTASRLRPSRWWHGVLAPSRLAAQRGRSSRRDAGGLRATGTNSPGGEARRDRVGLRTPPRARHRVDRQSRRARRPGSRVPSRSAPPRSARIGSGQLRPCRPHGYRGTTRRRSVARDGRARGPRCARRSRRARRPRRRCGGGGRSCAPARV
jgi:hypothetical protein